VVRTLRCGRNNPGSTPGSDIFEFSFRASPCVIAVSDIAEQPVEESLDLVKTAIEATRKLVGLTQLSLGVNIYYFIG
jgi:hypothetical protein